MIYTDLPIQNVEEDELNRAEFAKNLGCLINNYKNEESLVLSLMGEWGSGKTSLINLTLNELYENIIIKFDPWLFSEQKNLVLNFFNELTYGLKSAELENDSKLKDVIDNLRKILKFIKPDTFSVSINPLNTVNITAEYKNDNNEQSDESLEKFKNEINNNLKGLKQQKIVIVIDNIDRLNKLEIKEIFQLVKSLADFKNIIYILSFDKEIVLKSLDDYVSSPDIFLEKIIQIPINIPETEDYRLQKYFEKELKKLFQEKDVDLEDENFLTLINNLSFL